MAETVYALCFLTSAAAALLLLRGYRKSRARLLLWSGLGFAGLCVNNLMLIFDLVILPNLDLLLYRAASATVGLLLLVFGLLWENSG
jgi:cytochrome bd-type quinol oxidase subunit 2